jgi:hypothetical protein
MNDIEVVSQLDWSYYEKGMASLKQKLEQDPEMWDLWTKSDKRYMLICYPVIIGGHPILRHGKITGYLDCHISSDKLEDLQLFWEHYCIQQKYDTTRQHFIVDIHNRKVVEFMSVCM